MFFVFFSSSSKHNLGYAIALLKKIRIGNIIAADQNTKFDSKALKNQLVTSIIAKNANNTETQLFNQHLKNIGANNNSSNGDEWANIFLQIVYNIWLQYWQKVVMVKFLEKKELTEQQNDLITSAEKRLHWWNNTQTKDNQSLKEAIGKDTLDNQKDLLHFVSSIDDVLPCEYGWQENGIDKYLQKMVPCGPSRNAKDAPDGILTAYLKSPNADAMQE